VPHQLYLTRTEQNLSQAVVLPREERLTRDLVSNLIPGLAYQCSGLPAIRFAFIGERSRTIVSFLSGSSGNFIAWKKCQAVGRVRPSMDAG